MSEYPPRGGPEPGPMQQPGSEPTGQRLGDVGSQAGEWARVWGSQLYRTAERARVLAAEGLSRAANTLRASSTETDTTARRFADSLEQGATYLRETDVEGMRRNLVGLVRQYPGQALGAAFVAGFLVGRRLGRR